MSLHDDRVLIDELLARTLGASQRFIAHYDAFFRYVIYRSSPAAQAFIDDLMQDVYVCLWAHDFRVLRHWKGEHPLHAYLRTVIVRLVWERLNRLHPRGEIVTDDPLTEVSAGQEHSAIPETPEQLACAHQLIRIVCGALECLTAQDRNIVELRYFQNLNYREIAMVLGITTTNAGVRLARALGRLRKFLLLYIEEKDVFEFEGPSFAKCRSACNKTDLSSLILTQPGRNCVVPHCNRPEP
jgi:RNA polymerase sigma-70 factor (ECF subfamily)